MRKAMANFHFHIFPFIRDSMYCFASTLIKNKQTNLTPKNLDPTQK